MSDYPNFEIRIKR